MMFRSLIGGGGSGFTVQEPENNIVRGAYYSLAAALSGCQTSALPTYDEAYTIPSSKAQLIALRTMQICAEETGIADTVDPLAGSYFVETLTNEMEERIQAEMERVERMGGIVEGVKSGAIQAEVARQAYRFEQMMLSGEYPKVGVNRHVAPDADARGLGRHRALRVRRQGGGDADRAAPAPAPGAGAGAGGRGAGAAPGRGARPRQPHAADPRGGAGLCHAGRDGRRPPRRLGRAQGAEGLLSDLVGTAAAAWLGYKARSFELLVLTEGDHVLDVGCGVGEDVRAIAGLVRGSVGGRYRRERGQDPRRPRPDPGAAAARGLPRRGRLRPSVRGRDVRCLPGRSRLPPPGGPAKALAEMARVTRAGGRIAVSDTDYDSLVVEAVDPELTRRILQHHADRMECGRVGRKLPGLFLDAGLASVAVTPYAAVATEYDEEVLKLRDKADRAAAAGAITRADAARWVKSLVEAARAGRFVCAQLVLTVCGRKA